MSQQTWYRLDMSGGHALASDMQDGTVVATQQANGTWSCMLVYYDGYQCGPQVFQSFEEVRKNVHTMRTRRPNPYDPEKHEKYLKAGAGALAGTVAGMLVGGLPGIIAGHPALAAVGSQVGGVLGAAGGAVLGSKEILKTKKRLLR